jgi:proteasome accessory factor C
VPDVTLRVTPAARWISEYYPVARTSGDLVTLRVSEPGWLRQLILRLGAEAEVVDPLPAQDDAVLAAREALAQYDAWHRTPDPSV